MSSFFKECACCGKDKSPSDFYPSKSIFFKDKKVGVCKSCLQSIIDGNSGDLQTMDRICRFCDYPFYPDEWMKLYKSAPGIALDTYVNMYGAQSEVIDGTRVDWRRINDKWKQMEEKGYLEQNIQTIAEGKLNEARQFWGANYTDEELMYLCQLYDGMMKTQYVSGSLQTDQAQKLCKISLLIDNKIRAEEDFKDCLASYDKLVKIANFTPKNVKNANDFESVGELFAYLEKKGWENRFYDDVDRDIVDNTMKNIQAWCRKLYTNETNIAEEIEKRIEGLKLTQDVIDAYDNETSTSDDELDDFEMEAQDFEVDI